MARTAVVVGTVVTLAAVGFGGYFADAAVRGAAEQQVATQVQQELGLSEAPTIHLGGAPFSLALVTRSIPDASATADRVQLQVSGHDVTLTQVEVVTGRVALAGERATVATATGKARLGYDQLARIAGVPIEPAAGGRLEVRYTRQYFGRDVSFAVSARPQLDVAEAVIRLAEPRLDLAGNDIDITLTQDQLDAIVEPIDVELEHGLRLTAIEPTESDFGLVVGGEDLVFDIGR